MDDTATVERIATDESSTIPSPEFDYEPTPKPKNELEALTLRFRVEEYENAEAIA